MEKAFLVGKRWGKGTEVVGPVPFVGFTVYGSGKAFIYGVTSVRS